MWTCPQAVYSLRKREKFDSCVLPLFFSNCDLSVFWSPKKSAWKAINSANFEGFASSKIDDQDRKKKKDKPRRPRSQKQVKPVTSTTRPHKLPFYAISLPIYTRLLLLFLHRAFSTRKVYQGQKNCILLAFDKRSRKGENSWIHVGFHQVNPISGNVCWGFQIQSALFSWVVWQ